MESNGTNKANIGMRIVEAFPSPWFCQPVCKRSIIQEEGMNGTRMTNFLHVFLGSKGG